jgi:hypothetical protein
MWGLNYMLTRYRVKACHPEYFVAVAEKIALRAVIMVGWTQATFSG